MEHFLISLSGRNSGNVKVTSRPPLQLAAAAPKHGMMPLTIPLLVPERVVDWAVRKGYLEFEVHGAAGGDTPAQAPGCPPLAADAAGAGDAGQEADAEALDRRLVVTPASTHRPARSPSRGACVTPSLLRAPWQEAKTAGDSRDKAHQEQIGALSRDLQRASRHLIESQEYSTFLEGKLEEGSAVLTTPCAAICDISALLPLTPSAVGSQHGDRERSKRNLLSEGPRQVAHLAAHR